MAKRNRKVTLRADATLSKESGLATRSMLDIQALQCLAEEMLSVCLAGLRPFGVNPWAALKAVSSGGPRTGRAELADKIFRDIDLLGRVAQDWAEHPEFVDPSGHPKILPIYGTGATFATLTRRHFGKRSLKQILEFGVRTKVIERVGADKVAQLAACVMLTGNPVLMLAHIVLSMRRLLDVGKRNSLISAESRVPERFAYRLIPRKESERFANVMRPQLINTVEMANRLLMKYSVRDRPRRAGDELVGVHAYVFRD